MLNVDAHSVFMCILPGVNEITAYGGTYHTDSQIGGMILTGGVAGAEQYGVICPKPYSFTSGAFAGEVTAGTTYGGVEAWLCGTRFNWNTSSPPLNFAQLLAEAPNANCDQVGNSAKSYDITSLAITWNKVVIPVDVCDETTTYALVTTSDSDHDSPWMNVWSVAKCVDGNVTDTPDGSTAPPTVTASPTAGSTAPTAQSDDDSGTHPHVVVHPNSKPKPKSKPKPNPKSKPKPNPMKGPSPSSAPSSLSSSAAATVTASQQPQQSGHHHESEASVLVYALVAVAVACALLLVVAMRPSGVQSGVLFDPLPDSSEQARVML
jgi:hypothetical protein